MTIYIEKTGWLKTYRHIKQSYQYFKGANELNYYLIAPKGISMISVLIWFYGKKIRNIELVLPVKSLRPRLLQWIQRKNVRFSVTLIADSKRKEKEWKKICKLDGVIRIRDSRESSEVKKYEQERRVLVKSKQSDGFADADEFRLACGENCIYQCKYTSCLGKYVYIAKDGKMSFCPAHASETVVGHIGTPEQFFDSEVFADALQRMIAKREICKRECAYFKKCKGGCLFENDCEGFKERQRSYETEITHLLERQIGLDAIHLAKEISLLQMLCRVEK